MSERSVILHFAGGQSAETEVALDGLGYVDVSDPHDVIRGVRDQIERSLNAPARPHWVWIGDVYCFSQAVAAVIVTAKPGEEVR